MCIYKYHSKKLVCRLFLLLGIFHSFLYVGSVHASSDTKTISIAAEDNWQPYSYLGPINAAPLFDEGVSVFSLTESPAKNIGVKDLEGSTVGVTLGYSYASNIMNNAKIAKLEATSDTSQFKLLVAKRINFALVNTLLDQVLVNGAPTLPDKIKIVGLLSVHGFYMNFTKSENGKAMAELFEEGMLEFKKSGKYDRLYVQFLKQSGLSKPVK